MTAGGSPGRLSGGALRAPGPSAGILVVAFLAVGGLLLGARTGLLGDRDAALRNLEESRRLLEISAGRALERNLEQELRAARARIATVRADVLADGTGLLLVEAGRQVLPRVPAAAPGTATPAEALARALEGEDAGEDLVDAAEPGSPWRERLGLHVEFAAALAAGDEERQAAVFRAILAHRQRFVVPATRDLPFVLALLGRFARDGRPDPSLFRLLLLDGIDDGRNPPVESLARRLLEGRARFSAPDGAALAGRWIALAERFGVPTEPFRARWEEEPVRVGLPEPLPVGRTVLVAEEGRPGASDGGEAFGGATRAWLVEATAEDAVVGVRIDLGEQLAAVRDELVGLGLLEPGDGLIPGGPRDRAALSGLAPADLRPVVAAARLDEAAARIASSSRRTSLLVLSCFALATALLALGLHLQWRRHRWLQLRSDFLATVSHELRTPVASIRLLAETLERKVGGRPEARDYPARIVRDADRLGFLVDNVLSFHRLDKGRWIPGRETVRLAEVARAATEDLERGDSRRVEVQIDLEEALVEGDPELLRLLFSNLARNACQYNDRDPARVEIFRERGGDVRVRDNGRGIPEGDVDRVFEAFARSDGARSPGTGLGLAISRMIMGLHGGELALESTGPEGSTFRLRFPRRDR